MTRALLRTRAFVFGFAATSLLAACDGPRPFEPDAASKTATTQLKTFEAARQGAIAAAAEHLSAADRASAMAAAAHTCANGGYANFTTFTGEPFKNTGDCVSYAAHGGILTPKVVPPPVITDFQQVGILGCGTPNLVWQYSATFTGGTGVVDNGVGLVTSGAVFAGPSMDTPLTLTVTNSQGVSVSSGLFPRDYVIGCPPEDF